MIKAGYCQFAPVFGELERNREQVVSLIDDLDADLIVLPELPFTGYGFENREQLLEMAENPNDSVSVAVLRELCSRKGCRIVTGFAEKAVDKCYNSALLIGPAGIEGCYRKLHLFDREKLLFHPGDLPLEVFNVGSAKVGMMVCFDWIFPEVVRTLALGGADIICHPANLVLSYCQKTMLARCTENMVYAITANRIGQESHSFGNLEFTGQSQIVAPGGILLCNSGSTSAEAAVVNLDENKARDKMITQRNDVLKDRRPEFYS